MTTLLRDAFARLRDAVPPAVPTTELILHHDGDRPLATLRPADGPPRVFALDGAGIVELQPAADPRLPAAGLLADPARLCAALSPRLGDVSAPRLVSWRPGRRLVLRLLRAGEHASEGLFVKFLDRKGYARATAMSAALGTPERPLRLLRPFALLPEFCGHAATAARGRSLRELLAAGATPPWPLVDRALAALARAPVAGLAAHHDFAAARGAAVRLLQRAAVLEPDLAGLAERVGQLAPTAARRHGFVHGDLHDKQLFLEDDGATLIDLEGVGSGDPDFDVANLAEHVRLRALQHSGADDGSADALLDRHGPSGAERDRWRTVVRARLSAVYALRPRWTALAERLRLETIAWLDRLA